MRALSFNIEIYDTMLQHIMLIYTVELMQQKLNTIISKCHQGVPNVHLVQNKVDSTTTISNFHLPVVYLS